MLGRSALTIAAHQGKDSQAKSLSVSAIELAEDVCIGGGSTLCGVGAGSCGKVNGITAGTSERSGDSQAKSSSNSISEHSANESAADDSSEGFAASPAVGSGLLSIADCLMSGGGLSRAKIASKYEK